MISPPDVLTLPATGARIHGALQSIFAPVSPIAAAGIQVSTRLYPEFSAHLMRVTETAHWLEWQDGADPILRTPYPVKDGLIAIPNTPGTDLDWDEGGGVKRYRYDV
jgi:mandelate racemase